jgi:type I restriction enzyme R subunit
LKSRKSLPEMLHDYTEDQLIEQPAVDLFSKLEWETVSALHETFGSDGTLKRETSGEVVLLARLRRALERLNSALPAEAIAAAIDQLTRERSTMSLAAANRDVYELLKEGVRSAYPIANAADRKRSACA